MHSNARSDVATHDLNISSIELPASSGHLEEISSASLNFSEECDQVAATAETPNVLDIENAGPSSAAADITTQSEVYANAMAVSSGMQISASKNPTDDRNQNIEIASPSDTQATAVIAELSNHQITAATGVQANGFSDTRGISVSSSLAPDLSANTQEIMELVYEDVLCGEKEKESNE